ncbi:hypothetical protein WR25_08002 isoform B [Diploscapter pachys]|uniref:Uncharacterized protein n=1 Tax=Diploscapter pachys TaxID=2018661 RepID=A0A2A2JQ22_9BILA|nr:hypothetical protein WR25_08002 isoform B [Diploscapter pachys]
MIFEIFEKQSFVRSCCIRFHDILIVDRKVTILFNSSSTIFSNSLNFQLIANKFNGLHNPSYDVVETTSRELGPSEAHKKTYKCTLTFPEEGKTFVNIGYGKEAQKEICARKALTSLLGVPKDEVHKIIKGIALTKLRPDGTYISALHQIAATFRCELEVKVHHAEPTYEQKVEMLRKNIPAQTPAVAVYKITDYAEEGKMTKFTSRSYSTQQEAKEAAAAEALKKYFRVDMANLEKEKLEYQKMKKALQLHTPSQLLNERIQQRRALALNEKEKNMEATYEEIGIDPRTGHHKMKVSIDGQSFIGSGESRKIAKNQAALFAMRTLFKMEEVPKGPQKLSIPQSQLPCSKLCFEINEFSKIEYLNMCQYYGIKPSSWFSVFLLVNEKNEKRVLSMAGSNGAVLQGNQFLSSQGSSLLHIDSIVLARRSLVRNLMLELELAQKDSNKSILEMGEDALYRLKSNLKLVLYSSHAPDCSYSCEESPDKKLSYISFGGYSPAVETPQTMKEIKENDFIRVHSTSDKIFKWTHLGVQGALLSALMHPILPEIVIFGMRAPIDDCSLGYALYSRLSDDRYPFMLESANDYFEPSSTQPHVFTRGFDGIEMIYPNTGRSTSGAPSRLCKLEMFENFLKVAPHISRSSSYLEAKSHALIYNEAKKVFYETLKLYNWGNWQKKSQQAIDFHLMSADEL